MGRNWQTTFDDSDVISDAQSDRYEEVTGWLSDLEDYECDLTDNQFAFVSQTRERMESGPTARLTDRQYYWLKGLWERLVEGS